MRVVLTFPLRSHSVRLATDGNSRDVFQRIISVNQLLFGAGVRCARSGKESGDRFFRHHLPRLALAALGKVNRLRRFLHLCDEVELASVFHQRGANAIAPRTNGLLKGLFFPFATQLTVDAVFPDDSGERGHLGKLGNVREWIASLASASAHESAEPYGASAGNTRENLAQLVDGDVFHWLVFFGWVNHPTHEGKRVFPTVARPFFNYFFGHCSTWNNLIVFIFSIQGNPPPGFSVLFFWWESTVHPPPHTRTPALHEKKETKKPPLFSRG